MKLKTWMLVMLLLILPIKMLSAQQSKTNNQNSENEYGIDLNRKYDGTEVLEMIQIVVEEAEISIKESYEEGYKQATLELKPELEYWKTKYNQLDDKCITKFITLGSISFGLGFLLGNITGITIGIRL